MEPDPGIHVPTPTRARLPRDCSEEAGGGMVSLDLGPPQEPVARLLAKAVPWSRRQELSPER